MIAVDVNDVAEVYDAGLRVLNEGLGPDVAEAFLCLYFGGTGDYTAEKKLRPKMSRQELDGLKDMYRAKAAERAKG